MSKWILRKTPQELPPADWAEKLSISPFFLELLWRRGFRDYAALDRYLDARLKFLTPPAQWPLVPQAAELLASEILAGKKLAVWGDYDVDGITALTIVLDVLEAHGVTAMHHLPNRAREGYGLNLEGIEELAGNGCEVLLTVDCGISDHASIARARELGMTVIVSDHHLPPQELPPAHAFVNPRLPGAWPCEQLAGVGVAFYLMAAVNGLLAASTGVRYKMDQALDLVALGTLADVMQLTGENRILVRGGLGQMAKSPRPGLAALKVASGMALAGAVSSENALFRLVPRMNAAGRMGDAEIALEMLRAENYNAAAPMAEELDNRNQLRKSEEKRIFEEAASQAEELLAEREYAGFVLYGADWHAGIVGIVASRIVETWHRPALVLCRDGEHIKGSGRSVEGFDLYGGLSACSDLLLGFGGHRMAAGLKLELPRLGAFRQKFAEICHTILGDTPREPVLLLECELDSRMAADNGFLRELELMQPFGPGNEEPVFVSPPLIVKSWDFLGKSQDHVVLRVEDGSRRITHRAIGWRMAKEIPPSVEGKLIRLAYTTKLDYYNGMPNNYLNIRDWRLAEN